MNETRQISKNTLKNDKITRVCHYPGLLVGPQHRDKKWGKRGTTVGEIGENFARLARHVRSVLTYSPDP